MANTLPTSPHALPQGADFDRQLREMNEALMLGFIGTAVGAALGAAVATGLNALHIHVPISVQLFLMSDHLHLAVPPGAIVRAMLLITMITGVAALYPSLRAARLKPVTAMQHFG